MPTLADIKKAGELWALLGVEPKAMRLNRHIVSTRKMLSEVALAP
jgi:hypothetical protein